MLFFLWRKSNASPLIKLMSLIQNSFWNVTATHFIKAPLEALRCFHTVSEWAVLINIQKKPLLTLSLPIFGVFFLFFFVLRCQFRHFDRQQMKLMSITLLCSYTICYESYPCHGSDNRNGCLWQSCIHEDVITVGCTYIVDTLLDHLHCSTVNEKEKQVIVK